MDRDRCEVFIIYFPIHILAGRFECFGLDQNILNNSTTEALSLFLFIRLYVLCAYNFMSKLIFVAFLQGKANEVHRRDFITLVMHNECGLMSRCYGS